MNQNEIHSAIFNVGIVMCWGIQEVKHEGDASGTFIPCSLYVFYLCRVVVEEGVHLM